MIQDYVPRRREINISCTSATTVVKQPRSNTPKYVPAETTATLTHGAVQRISYSFLTDL